MIKQVINNYQDSFLRIEYMIGNTCNYKCNYCFPGSNEGDMPWPNLEILKKNFSHLLNHYVSQGKTKFELYLVGGEPTIWKDLPEFTEHIKSKYDISIIISTNGSCSPYWWSRNAKFYHSVDISVHHESADVEHIIAVADTIYEQNITVVANVLMDPKYFDKCKAIVEQLKASKYRWPIIAKSVHFNGQTFYNEHQKKYFNGIKRYPNMFRYFTNIKKQAKRKKIWIVNDLDKKQRVPSDNWFALNQLNYFQGWQCNLGVEHIKIHPNGEISGNCRQRILGYSSYFNLYDLDFSMKFTPSLQAVKCEQFICTCSGEIILNKQKI